MDVPVERSLVLVEAHATGEHDVRTREELTLAPAHLGGRALESRELVHAVVHDRLGHEVLRERERHRRVVPEEVGPHAVVRDELVQQARQRCVRLVGRQTRRQMRHGDPQLLRGSSDLQPRCARGLDHRLLEEEDAAAFGATREQMLGPLEDEVPTKVGETDDVGGNAVGVRRRYSTPGEDGLHGYSGAHGGLGPTMRAPLGSGHVGARGHETRKRENAGDARARETGRTRRGRAGSFRAQSRVYR